MDSETEVQKTFKTQEGSFDLYDEESYGGRTLNPGKSGLEDERDPKTAIELRASQASEAMIHQDQSYTLASN